MDTRTEERVNGWDSRSFSGGYERLRDLSDRDFSGAVQTGRTWLFMLNGRIVGLFDGTIEAFEDASGTVYEAPDPALPLLFTMQEKGGETQAKYYTEDTPISEADGTLSSGSFTGYIELSENVLSGDYFVVYYGGRSMAAAYVGNSERLLSGDEAFERADDEVGIYEVKNVDIEVTELPEPDEPDDAGLGGAGAGGAGAAGGSSGGAGAGGAGAAGGASGGPGTDADHRDDATASTETTAGGVDAGGTDDAGATEAGDTPDPLGGSGSSDAPDPLDGPTGADASARVDGSSADDTAPASGTGAGEGTDGPGPADGTTTADLAGGAGAAGGERASDERPGGVEDPTPAAGDDADDSDPGDAAADDPSAPAGVPDPLGDTSDTQGGAGADKGEADSHATSDEHSTAEATDHRTSTTPGETTDHQPSTARATSDSPTTADTGDAGADVDLDEVAEELDLMMDEPDDAGESTAAAGDPLAEPEPTGDSLGTSSAGEEPPSSAGNEDLAADADRTADPGGTTDVGRSGPDGATGGAGPSPDYESEQEWRQTRTIPSLNPDETNEGQDQARATRSRGNGPSSGRSSTGSGRTAPSSTDRQGSSSADGPDSPGESRPTTDRSSRTSNTGSSRERTERGRSSERTESQPDDDALGQDMLEREDTIDRLKLELQELETERDDLAEQRDELAEQREALRERVATLESERDELATENEELNAEVERLESTVAELQAEIDDLESSLEEVQGAAATASRKLSRAEALAGTNLFVRYGSKSDATLADAHAGEADPGSVAENLRLEHHTQFDAADVSVEGQAFEEFLYGTMEYQFVDWAVNRLLFEVRDSGNAGAVQPLYDALPDVDRAELHGEVTLATPEGEDDRTHVFDVVLRDRMGNPLAVVELNDSRDPATQEMMVSLNENATGTKHAADTLAAAFMVTASFFKPDALETASEATSGSLLSRDSRRSFVKLSRKSGYHLCLVESRDGDFHINVPEL